MQTRIECNPPHSRTGFYRAYPEKVKQSFMLSPREDVVGYDVEPITHQLQIDGRLITKTYTGVKLTGARGDDRQRVLGGDPDGKRSAQVLAFELRVSFFRCIVLGLVSFEATVLASRRIVRTVPKRIKAAMTSRTAPEANAKKEVWCADKPSDDSGIKGNNSEQFRCRSLRIIEKHETNKKKEPRCCNRNSAAALMNSIDLPGTIVQAGHLTRFPSKWLYFMR